MNSRDRLIESGELRMQIEKELEDILKNHLGLKQLKHKRHEEDINNRLDDSKPLSDVLEKMLKKSPILSRLFISGLKIPNPINLVGKNGEKEFKGRRFPTYFKVEKAYPIEKPKEVPKNNRKFRVQFKTDAVNDYFERETDKGVHNLLIDGIPFQFNKSMNLWNGHATLNIELPDYLEVGETVTFKSITTDINSTHPFDDDFSVKVVKENNSNGGGTGERKKPSRKESGNDSRDNSGLALPEIIRVKRDDWDQHGFDKESALKVEFNGEELGWAFYVNIENLYLLSELKDGRNNNKMVEAQFVYSLVLLGLSLINKLEDKENKNLEMGIPEMINIVSRSIAPVLVPMIKSLGELEEESIYEEAMIV